MSNHEIDFAELSAALEAASQEAYSRYECVLREMCEKRGMTLVETDQVLATGKLSINDVEVRLVVGSLANPWTLQVLIDMGSAREGDSREAFYQSLLLANAMLVGSGGVFGIDAESGRAMMFGYLSMCEARFDADDLADYLHQITLCVTAYQADTLFKTGVQSSAIFV